MRRKSRNIFYKIKAKAEKIRIRLFQRTFVKLVYNVAQTIGRDVVGIMAGGISYYFFLSLFPLVTGLISILGFLLPSEYIYDVIFEFLSRTIPVSTDFIESAINATIQLRGPLGIISIIGLLIGGTSVLTAISMAINRTWGLQPKPYLIRKPLELAMILSIGFGVLVLLIIAIGLDYLNTLTFPGSQIIGYLLPKLLSFVLITFSFLILYKLTPRKKVYWRDIWLGSVIGAAMFRFALLGFTFFVNHFANYEYIYGYLASLVAFLTWIYISSYILILCAEFNAVYYSMFKQHSGKTLQDKNIASH